MSHTHSLLHLFIMYRVLLRLCHAFVWSSIENLRKVSYSSTIIGSSFTFCSVCISLPDCLLCWIFDFSLPSIENPRKVSYSSTMNGSSFTLCSICISLPYSLLCWMSDFSLKRGSKTNGLRLV